MKFKAEITRRKDGVSIDTQKTFKDFDTAACYIANRSRSFVPWSPISESFGMLSGGRGMSDIDFATDALRRIAEATRPPFYAKSQRVAHRVATDALAYLEPREEKDGTK